MPTSSRQQLVDLLASTTTQALALFDQSDIGELILENERLKVEVRQLREKEQGWKAFKKWWLESVKKGKKRRKLSQQEEQIFQNAGMESEESELVLRPVQPTTPPSGSKRKAPWTEKPSSKVVKIPTTLPQSERPLQRRTLNQEYQIDPERNAGVPFAFAGSEKNRSTRNQMHPHDCPCCADYWVNIGQLPLAPGKKEPHKLQTSRHRDWGIPNTTPPGYWDIGFPDTQQEENIKQQAAKEHQKHRERVQRDPRYVKRK